MTAQRGANPQTCPPWTACRWRSVRPTGGKLEQYIRDYYKHSAFNMCPHQPLRMMTGEPLRIIVDPTVWSFAVHKPVPVPIHWQQEVKDQIDKDCKMVLLKVCLGAQIKKHSYFSSIGGHLRQAPTSLVLTSGQSVREKKSELPQFCTNLIK